MGMPAARVGDLTSHAPPLSPGPGSPNVFIGGRPAWRALPAAMGMALNAAQKVADAIVKTAESATMASDPLTKAGFLAAEAAAKTAATTALTALMNGMGAASMGLTLGKGQPDKHMCSIPTAPAPAPHGMGMVIDGSGCVLTNGLPQSAQGDKVLEALGGPDPIAQGEPRVLVGKCGGGGGLFAAVAALVQQAIDSVLKAANAVAAFVKDAVGFVKGLVQAVIDKVVAAARRITQAVVDAVVGAVKRVGEAVTQAIAAGREALRPSPVKGMEKDAADKAVAQARKDAIAAVDKRIKDLDAWDPATEKSFKEWFGDTDPATRAKMRERLVKTRDKLESFGLDNFAPDKDAFAYVYPDKDDKMYLGKRFGNAPPTGRDSKAGTLVHEASHYESVGGTDDVEHDGGKTYGTAAARKLAKDAPGEAQRNADNFEYFVEDGM